MTDHDRHPLLDVGHRHAPGRGLVPVDDDPAVHLLIGDLDPFALEADLGLLVRGRVEAVGEGAGEIRHGGFRVFGVGRRRAVLDEVADDLLDLGVGRRLDGTFGWRHSPSDS